MSFINLEIRNLIRNLILYSKLSPITAGILLLQHDRTSRR